MSETLSKKIRRKWQTVMILTFIVVAIAFSVSIFMPAKYSSEMKMIIIQNHTSSDVDAFSAAKSAEYLSDILSNVVYTESFIQNMFDAPMEVTKDFSHSSEERMKIWKKTVDVSKENNTGILTIATYDPSREEAQNIAESIAWALNIRGTKYHGGGKNIKIQIIDGPITSEKPATPNIWVNTLLALIVGFAGAVATVHFFDDFELNLFKRREKDNKKSDKKDDDNDSENGDSLEDENINDQSPEKMAENLDKIRENLKTQMVMDDYAIETDKKEKTEDEDEMEEIEKALEVEETETQEEEKEEIQKEEKIPEEVEIVKEEKETKPETETVSSFKKSEAPQNLPTFSEEEEKKEIESVVKPVEENSPTGEEKGFISMEELNREAEKMGLAGDKPQEKTGESESKHEASSEEVKERLNKLLKGEL